MLQKEAVASKMIEMIKELQNDSLFKDHILVGGTALTLQIGHRTSTDIDLFTQKPQSAVVLTNYFKKKFKDTEIDTANDDFVRIYANGIKIEMVQYEGKIIENPKFEEGIRFLGINEIAAMKLDAITKRTEPRDFIDIAYLLQEIPIKKMFELYKERYETLSPLYMKRTLLTKSKNIKDRDWLVGGIKMLKNDIKLKDVPIIIEKAIEEYNNNINIGNKKKK